MDREAILLIGLQAAGKSTFYRRHFVDTHELLSMDLLPNNRHPRRRLEQLLRESLDAGRSVVLDNTHPTRAERELSIQLARESG